MKEGIIISVPSAPLKSAGPQPALNPAGEESGAGPLFLDEMTGAMDRLDRAEGGALSLGDAPGKDASQASDDRVGPSSKRALRQPAKDTDNPHEPGLEKVFQQDGMGEFGNVTAPKTPQQQGSKRSASQDEGKPGEKGTDVYGALRESSMGLASETGMPQPRIGALENPSRGAVERIAGAVLAPANDSQGLFDLPQRGATEGGGLSKAHAGPPPASAVPKRGHSEPTSQGVREGVSQANAKDAASARAGAIASRALARGESEPSKNVDGPSRANTKEATPLSGAGHAPRGPERQEPHSTGSVEGPSRAKLPESKPAGELQVRPRANDKEAITASAAPLAARAPDRPEAHALSAGGGRLQGEGKEALRQVISLAEGLPAATETHRAPATGVAAQAKPEQVPHSGAGLSPGHRTEVGLPEIGNRLGAGGSQVVGAERADAIVAKAEGQMERIPTRIGTFLVADSAVPKAPGRESAGVSSFAEVSVTDGSGPIAEAKRTGPDVYLTVENPAQGADLRTISPARAVDGRTVTTLAQDLMQQFDDLEPGQLKVVELRLDPPELGRLNVKVSLAGDEVRVVFSTAQGAAREAIEGALPRLREQLEALGLTLQEGFVGQEHSKNSRGGRGSSERMALAEAPEESGEAEDVKKSSSRRLDLRA